MANDEHPRRVAMTDVNRSTRRIVHARASEGTSRWALAQSFGLPGSLAERRDGHERSGRDEHRGAGQHALQDDAPAPTAGS
jgi:hypothetical protein